MTKEIGVVIQHGCKCTIFISKETLENSCAIMCRGCGGMIGLSLFGSTIKQQLLDNCEEMTDEEIQKRLGKTKDGKTS